MDPVQPLDTLNLFPGLNFELMRVLQNLPPEAWAAPTACLGWSVKDVATHLLGGTLGRLASSRDGHPPRPVVATASDYAGLVAAINQSNNDWVRQASGLELGQLLMFLSDMDGQLYEYFASLPPFGYNGPAVAWAGEAQSPNWFDIAREYTEKWLHQQHIREAVGVPVLAERRYLYPVLDTFLRALPHTYRDVPAADGAALSVQITGPAGGDWSLVRETGRWRLYSGLAPNPFAVVRLDQAVAWRLFTKGLSPAAAAGSAVCLGDPGVGLKLLEMVSIMA